MSDYDLIIAGGGLVGASLAAALRGTGSRVAVVEAVPPGAPGQPSFDERQTALAPSSRRLFEALDLWPALAAEASVIRSIHVSERGGFGFTRMNADAEGLDALGHVVPNRVLGAVLQPALANAPGVDWLAPARVESVDVPADGRVCVRVSADGEERMLTGRLLAVADGADSPIRQALGIGLRQRDYGQSAVVANVRPERRSAGRAFERFTRSGPLALLPAGSGRMALVWTMPHAEASDIAALDEERFLRVLQRRFGWRLGRLQAVGERSVYPLRAINAERMTAGRAVVLGNAAHTLHPVAGQGFNLALRDVAELAERVAAAVTADGDCGDAELLAGYAAARQNDYRRTFAFTDLLVHAFSNRLPGLTLGRNAALLGLDLFPGARRYLMHQAMGRAGRQPRLARGLPLVESP